MTKEQAIILAEPFGLEKAVELGIKRGFTPEEILVDWDIMLFNYDGSFNEEAVKCYQEIIGVSPYDLIKQKK